MSHHRTCWNSVSFVPFTRRVFSRLTNFASFSFCSYVDSPLLIDFHCDASKFPFSPPTAHFHSWTRGMGRCNPNLFVLRSSSRLVSSRRFFELSLTVQFLVLWFSGTRMGRSACRSLGLGLLEMRVKVGSESLVPSLRSRHVSMDFRADERFRISFLHSPLKSSLLQTFVSIQGLVLVREPWFCEPAFVFFFLSSPWRDPSLTRPRLFTSHSFEKLRGTKEATVNSRQYRFGPSLTLASHFNLSS